ncbi:nucleotide kinase [Erysipelothrix larvae]|uniref:Nucleotide kinase n=1 Tax=Erysipelothrix larvae TaxID=1514105 RepID=A0A109UH42_9FIRM|nr:AAA family ATPase [Erysipelothrix larvae]AMC93658.1 nucleotide kinase [Erysipelothrix larvae]
MKTLYMIGGTMGVGKTTICQQLKNTLPQSVFLDGDWCWDANPFLITEETKAMVIDNICYLLNNFMRCSAYDNVVFGWVMHEQTIIDSVIERLDLQAYTTKCISLVVNESELRNRLAQDIQAGIRNESVVQRSIERLPMYQNLNTIKIDTSNKSIQTIVKEIIEC